MSGVSGGTVPHIGEVLCLTPQVIPDSGYPLGWESLDGLPSRIGGRFPRVMAAQ